MSLLASDDPLDPFMINCIPFTSRCNFRMVNEEVAFLVAIKIGWKDYYSRIRLRCNFLGVFYFVLQSKLEFHSGSMHNGGLH